MEKEQDTASELTKDQLVEVAAVIIRELPHIGLDSVTGQGWVENGRALRKALQKALVPPAPEQKDDVFPTKVNYDLSVEFLVAQGNYDWKNLDINSKHFQTTRKGEATLNLELVHLNQVLTSKEVLKELDKRGLRPAELHELLSFGAQYSEVQRKYPIVALGSVWRGWSGDGCVPALWDGGGGRGLGLGPDCFDDGWFGCYRFAAVSK